jgi:ribosomal-protein-alanine N-acetyltransferase
MRLEPTTAEDAPALAVVHARAFDHGWRAEEIAALIRSPGGLGLCVREADTVLGFVLVRAIAGQAEILTLAVEPAARRRGIARALITAAMAAARAAGAEAMFLEVAADNAAALGLYAAAGFADVGVRPGYYRRETGAADARVLRRDLNTPFA